MIGFVTRLALFVGVCIALVIVNVSTASAKGVTCVVLEIHAKAGPTKMARTIPPKLARKLRRPPFSSWKNFSMVRAVRRKFSKPGVRKVIGLQRGSLVLTRHRNANNQYKLLFMLKNPRGKRVLRTKVGVSPRTYFLVAGLPLRGGAGKAIQVLALTCMPSR